MQSALVFGLIMMMSGAALAYLSLPDKQGRSPYFLARSGLVLIYPAIILSLLGIGVTQIILSVMS